MVFTPTKRGNTVAFPYPFQRERHPAKVYFTASHPEKQYILQLPPYASRLIDKTFKDNILWQMVKK
ncbi:hypothetical protein HMPREF0663_10717 [Hoylesella oralis ATCC 33269]|uniref:Uncharacterized protein n=1 Tax=Hoylesella oralis ATCC 33269 TaxID=873533 RepID=E7RLI3_9BACT|nr:hypothetical protein HMPREF0663_10717 [Hoylesella oralis ATCC 33269]